MPRYAARQAAKLGFDQAVNDFRRAEYGGLCPPRGHGTHHYRFRLLALSIGHLEAKPGYSCADVEREARKYRLNEAMLTGLYER